jgi:hypothetical protein
MWPYDIETTTNIIETTGLPGINPTGAAASGIQMSFMGPNSALAINIANVGSRPS